MYSKELFKGTLKTIILRLLEEEGKMYGYQITQRVRELTEGELQLTEGALYPTLHKLEAQGWLTVEKTKVAGRVRKYYLLSDLGREQSRHLLDEFRQFVLSVNRIFQLQLGE